MHILQFLNYIASIIYAAFLKGVSARSPGGYDHVFGSRHEEGYEDGSEALNDAAQYSSHAEPKWTSLPSKMKAEQCLIGECLPGDLLYISKQSTEISLSPSPVNKLFHHRKPLLKNKAYATYKTRMGNSNHKQLLLSTHVRKHVDESNPMKVLTSRLGKQKRSSKSTLSFGKIIWENSGKLMMFVLITLVAAVQAFHNTTHADLVSAGNATDSFPMIPILTKNQALFNMMPKNTSDLAEIHQYVNISEGLLQKILHQSDIIINDLQELAKFLTTNKDTNRHLEGRSNPATLPRVVRSLPTEESSMCEIERDTLINLRNELQATLEQPIEGGNNNCQLNFDSDGCEELIKLMLCGYTHLRNGFLLAVRNNMSEAIIMANKLSDVREKYIRYLDSEKRSLSQIDNRRIAELEEKLQEQQNNLNAWISSLRKQKIKSCISEISSGKIESAVADFKSLNGVSVLIKIIRSVYSEYGNSNQIDNIVNFISELSKCGQHIIAYIVLFAEMRRNNHLSSPYVLIVAHAARTCMGETFMKSYVERVLDTWAHQVRNYNVNAHIMDFARNHGNAFRANLPNLIDKAYANELSNVENIIMFVRELPYIADAAIGYSSLFDMMRSNKHIDSYQTLMLAYRVKEFMDMSSYPWLEQNYKDMFDTLTCQLPNSVKGLIWSSRNSCKIFNVHYREYLYAANGYFNYAAYTWVEGVEVTSSNWQLNMLNGGRNFKIKNTHYNRFLYSSAEKYNSERRYLRTGTCGDCSDTDWRLESEGENFLIWSSWHDNYLYADYGKKDSDRRFVFGWSPSSIPDSVKMERRWRIVC